ncbi:MAG: hypothetical protein AB1345_12210 [Chloroflexota bacterium]
MSVEPFWGQKETPRADLVSVHQRHLRPRSVTVLSLGAFIFAALHLLRLGNTLALWGWLSDLPLTVSPLYLAITGGFWGAAGLVMGISLWRGWVWAPMVTRILCGAFALFYWIERLLVESRTASNPNTPFALALTGLLLGWILHTLHSPYSRAYFGELDD